MQVRHLESKVVDGAAVALSGRILLPQEQQRVGELDHFRLAELGHPPSEQFRPESFVRFDIGDVEMVVPDRERVLAGRQQLCGRRGGEHERQAAGQKGRMDAVHNAIECSSGPEKKFPQMLAPRLGKC